MSRIIQTLLAVLMLSGLPASHLYAGEHRADEANTASILVYRGKDLSMKGVRFTLFVNEQAQGRLLENSYKLIRLQPGTHRIWSNLHGEMVEIELMAGERVFVSSALKSSGGKIKTRFNEVSEALALHEMPSLSSALEDHALLSQR